jgi:hypothetical protein
VKKTLALAGAALLAASVASLSAPTPAEAKKGFGGGHHHHHHRHHWHRHPVIVAPVVTESYRVRKAAPVVPQKKKVVVSYTDGKGRVYDPASKAWHDGQNRCWSGQAPWTFKGGSWFYGSAQWVQSGDTWSTTAAEAPIAIACDAVPAFAAKVPGTGGPKDLGGYSSDPVGTAPAARNADDQKRSAPAVTANGEAGRGDACKRHFPSGGGTVTMPCTN